MKLLKIVSALFVALLVLALVGLLAVSLYFTNERMRALLTEQVQNSMPQAIFTIEKLDFSPGLTSGLVLQNLLITDQKKRPALQVQRLAITAPVLAMLTTGGRLQIDLLSLLVDADLLNELQENESKKADPVDAKKSQSQAGEGADSFLSSGIVRRNAITVNLQKVTVRSGGASADKRLETRIAELSIDDLSMYSDAKLAAIGTVATAALTTDFAYQAAVAARTYLSDGKAAIDGKLELKNIQAGDKKFEQLTVTHKVVVNGPESLAASLVLALDDLVSGKMQVAKEKGVFTADRVELRAGITRLLAYGGAQLRGKVKEAAGELVLSGSVSQNADGLITPDIDFKTTMPVAFAVDAKTNATMTIKGFARKQKFQVQTGGAVWGGRYQASVEGSIARLTTATQLADVENLEIDLNLNKVNVPQTMLTGDTAKKEKNEKPADTGANQKPAPISVPQKFLVRVNINQLGLGREKLSLRGSIRGKDQLLSTDDIRIELPGGAATMAVNSAWLKRGQTKGNVKMDFKKLSLATFAPFMPAEYQGLRGLFAAKGEARFTLPYSLKKPQLAVDITVRNLSRFRPAKKTRKLDQIVEGINALQSLTVTAANRGDGAVVVRKLNLTARPANFIQAMTPKSVSVLDANTVLNVSGALTYFGPEKIEPDLQLKMTRPLRLRLNNDLNVSTSLQAKVTTKQIAATLRNRLLKGSAVIGVQAPFILPKAGKTMQLPPLSIQFTANGLDLPEDRLRRYIYAGSDGNTKTAKKSKKQQATAAGAGDLPVTQTKVLVTAARIAGQPLNISGDIATTKNSVASKNLYFGFGKGKSNSSFRVDLPAGKPAAVQFKSKMNDFNLDAFNIFLPASVEKIAGNFTGDVSGEATVDMAQTPMQVTHDIKADFLVRDGQVKGLNVTDSVHAVAAKIPFVGEKLTKKQYKLGDRFETLQVQGRFQHSHYAIAKAHFIGLQKRSEFTGSGNVYPLADGRTGRLDITYTDHSGEIARYLQEHAGTKTLPIRLTGQGMNLTPDYAYTLQHVAKLAAKKQVARQAKKVKARVKEEQQKQTEKLKEKAKKSVEKVFKDIFK